MSAIFNKTCTYAVQAAIYLAGQPKGKLISQVELAERLSQPQHFLGKILQSLVKSGLIMSTKGKFGGFTLAKDASKIKLIHIVHAIEGENFLEGCFLGLPQCGGSSGCSSHIQWSKIKKQLTKLLNRNIKGLHHGFEEKLN
ncbi:MAG: Rrf2 family transcriptional regulator [Fibrobacteria bacterium]|nr:Rrf2 family transcriptional regulator [Fibrobacteria bacterium]